MIRVGTSSWADPGFVKHWYPKGLAARDRLRFYAERFDVVELNSSFYATPPRDSVERWVEITPEDFGFHVKLHRLLSLARMSLTIERLGLADLTIEKLRKTDHLNPLMSRAHLDEVAAAAGFDVTRFRYYTPLLSSIAENILVPMAAHAMARRAARATSGAPGPVDRQAMRTARMTAKRRLAQRGLAYRALQAMTQVQQRGVATAQFARQLGGRDALSETAENQENVHHRTPSTGQDRPGEQVKDPATMATLIIKDGVAVPIMHAQFVLCVALRTS